MNLGSIRTDLYDRMGLNNPPTSAAVTSRIDRFINQTHRQILGEKGFSKLRRHLLTAACVANSPYMVTPQAMTKIIAVSDRTNRWVLDEVRLQDIRRSDPGLTQTVTYPDRYFIENLSAVTAQDPTVACQPFAVSDVAGDDNTKKVFIEGIRSNGTYISASHILNGISPVAVDTNTDWVIITKFYFQLATGATATPAGNVTLTQGSGGVELSRIVPGRSYPRYTRIHLYGTPTQANTYYVDGELHIEDMAQVDDEPMLPEDWHWLLVSGSMCLEYRRRERLDLLSGELGQLKVGKDALKEWIATKSGVSKGPQAGGKQFSALGPNFSAGA